MDLFLEYGGDLVGDQNGDISTATDWDEVRQRILRRLLTNSRSILPSGEPVDPEYIYDVTYGLNARRLVDQPQDAAFRASLTQAVYSATMSDAALNTLVPPSVRVIRPDVRTLYVVIGVTMKSGKPGTIALQVT